MDASQIWTLIAAAIGMVTGIGGLIVALFAESRARKADRRAIAAEEKGEIAQRRDLWTEAIMAGHDLVTINVLAESAKAPLGRLRAACTELIDGLPAEQYGGLADWLKNEHRRLVLALDYAYLWLEGKPETVENVLEAHRRASMAAGALVTNLRHFRQLQPGKEVDDEILTLTRQAEADSAWLASAIGGLEHG